MGGVVNIITRRRSCHESKPSAASRRTAMAVLGFSGTTGCRRIGETLLISASFYDQQSVGAGDRSFSSSGSSTTR